MPVLAAAFCPHPPLLVPELAGGASAELDGLRAACEQAVGSLAAYGVPVLVLGPAATSQTYGSAAAGNLAPWGVDVRAGGGDVPTLPLSLTVGAWLLDRGQVGLDRRSYDALADQDRGAPPPPPPAEAWVLLVMGDGSSTRTAKAPGGLNEGAEAYDAAVEEALRKGDAGLLASAAAPGPSRAVGAGGAAAWRAAARLLSTQPTAVARVLATEAPYGVGYPVALWSW